MKEQDKLKAANESRSFKRRLFGLFKTAVSAAYWYASITSGGSVPGALFVIGLGATVAGRLLRGAGFITGSETLQYAGAKISDVGVKLALSPIFVSAWGADAIGETLRGKKSSFFRRQFENCFDWVSGINTEKQKILEKHQTNPLQQDKVEQQEAHKQNQQQSLNNDTQVRRPPNNVENKILHNTQTIKPQITAGIGKTRGAKQINI